MRLPLSPLQQEQAEKEAKQKMKMEAHMYCTIKLARLEDLMQQVGCVDTRAREAGLGSLRGLVPHSVCGLLIFLLSLLR